MKKALTLFAGVAFVAILFTSCKKDYTCTCTETATGTKTTYTFPKVSKKVAKTDCDSWTTLMLGTGTCVLN